MRYGKDEIPGCGIVRAREREQPAALVANHLRDDMSGPRQSHECDQPSVPGHPQSAVADEARAHQRRRLDIAVARVDREAIALVRSRQLGIAAIDLIAGRAARATRRFS